MKRTWLAVVSCVVGLQLTQAGSLSPVAFANGGGIGAAGGGTGYVPDPGHPPFEYVTTAGALTLPVQGKVPGASDGSLRLVFTLFEQNTQLYSETRSVSISNQSFSTRFGASTLSGLPPSLLAGTRRAEIRWARESSPSEVVGTLQLGAAPYAMTLSPGAQIKSTSSAPALTVTNTSTSVRATASSTTARGIVGESTSGAGGAYGVEGRALSSGGAAGHFVNSVGDLIIGRASSAGEVMFRVANNGDVYVRGTKIGQTGQKGDRGLTGDKGDRGLKGDTGPRGDPGAGVASTFCVVRSQSTCVGVCTNGSELVAAAQSPCATSGGCSFGSSGSSCCVCTSTH